MTELRSDSDTSVRGLDLRSAFTPRQCAYLRIDAHMPTNRRQEIGNGESNFKGVKNIVEAQVQLWDIDRANKLCIKVGGVYCHRL